MIVGVDYDTFKATLCVLDVEKLTKPELFEARWRPNRQTGSALTYLEHVPPELEAVLGEVPGRSVFWVERGYGQSRQSDFLLGAYLGAIMATLTFLEKPANLVDLREWKAMITERAGVGVTKAGKGNGNAKKEVANQASRAVLSSLWNVDASAWTPDQLDAFGVAYCGRQLNRQALEKQGHRGFPVNKGGTTP